MNVVALNRLPLPLPLMPVVGGLAGLAFGIVFGAISTRRAGTVFAMISLGIAELVSSGSNILRSFFGGEEGITANRTKMLRLFDLSFGPQIQVYYLIAAWCLICAVAMYAITRTPLGRLCNAVRENPERVEFLGYEPQAIRIAAFCLSACSPGSPARSRRSTSRSRTRPISACTSPAWCCSRPSSAASAPSSGRWSAPWW